MTLLLFYRQSQLVNYQQKQEEEETFRVSLIWCAVSKKTQNTANAIMKRTEILIKKREEEE